MLKHYGLDAAEVEHLKAANLSDEEINDLNKKRVQEQMDAEQEGLEMDDDKPAEGSLGAAVASSGMDSDEDDELLASDTPKDRELLDIWNKMKQAFAALPKTNIRSKGWNDQMENIARPFLKQLEDTGRSLAKAGKLTGPVGTSIGYRILAERA